jgi:hypothetical protein
MLGRCASEAADQDASERTESVADTRTKLRADKAACSTARGRAERWVGANVHLAHAHNDALVNLVGLLYSLLGVGVWGVVRAASGHDEGEDER